MEFRLTFKEHIDPESLYDSSRMSLLTRDVWDWLEEQQVTYRVFTQETADRYILFFIQIPDDNQAMLFKLRWL